jgi:hypothetical protein
MSSSLDVGCDPLVQNHIRLVRNEPIPINNQTMVGMRMKEDFSNEEWNNLLTLPYAVSITVIAAAPSFLGA